MLRRQPRDENQRDLLCVPLAHSKTHTEAYCEHAQPACQNTVRAALTPKSPLRQPNIAACGRRQRCSPLDLARENVKLRQEVVIYAMCVLLERNELGPRSSDSATQAVRRMSALLPSCASLSEVVPSRRQPTGHGNTHGNAAGERKWQRPGGFPLPPGRRPSR